ADVHHHHSRLVFEGELHGLTASRGIANHLDAARARPRLELAGLFGASGAFLESLKIGPVDSHAYPAGAVQVEFVQRRADYLPLLMPASMWCSAVKGLVLPGAQ
ncbi:MAG: hypothetical protein JO318_17580, partial [Chloroflexi bacterium]|nr:hypothetical protein [Chloroflexota bacterium]